MLSEWIDKIWAWIMHAGMPLVYAYHLLTSNIFFNTAAEDAQGFERAGNIAFIPVQYLFAGEEAVREENGLYQLKQRFDYQDRYFWVKTGGCILLLPASAICGTLLKGMSYISPKTRKHHREIESASHSEHIKSNLDYYKSLGLQVGNFRSSELLSSEGYLRRPEDKKRLIAEREALKEIVKILEEAQIVFWVDCGTCLGVYRYGGVIPWDNDIDIEILQPDFENAKKALRKLDPAKYQVQDWSSRDKPYTYLKVYVKETRALIDIYHCAIDEENKQLYTIVSNENCVFLPEAWKIRERKCAIPIPYSTIFPLKKAYLEDILVPIPNKIKEYLQSKYGENITPSKVYNEKTNRYEKVPDHPYWK